MGISLVNIIIILVIVLILFGAGKLPNIMGDLGKGIKNFKDGLKEEDHKNENPPLLKNDKQNKDKN